VTSARDTDWLTRHLVGQPLKTFEQAMAAEAPAKIGKTYVYCSSPAMGAFDQFAEKVRDDRKWRYHQLPTGHDAMVTTPGDLAKILVAEGKD
jgi:hypothetical protein